MYRHVATSPTWSFVYEGADLVRADGPPSGDRYVNAVVTALIGKALL
jgi:hypothetical protein